MSRLWIDLTPDQRPNQRTQYLWGVVLVSTVTFVAHQSHRWISEDNLMLWFLVSVIAAALYWGEGPALLVAFLSFLALDFGVFRPRFDAFRFDLQYILSLMTFLGVGFVISRLSNHLRRQAEEARRSAQISHAIHDFGSDLVHIEQVESIPAAFQQRVSGLFEHPLRLTLGADQSCRLEGQLDESQRELAESFTQQAQLAIQRLYSQDEMRQAMLLAERERTQNALLNSLSHDLQTPLASVAGSLQVLADPNLTLEPEVRQQLLQLAREQTERLRRLVDNLLQLTRLDGPGLKLNLQTVDPEELLTVVKDHCPPSLRGRISFLLRPGVPELQVDYVLVANLLQNLLENAHKYTPEGSPVELEVYADGPGWARFDVRDRGPGIPAEDIPKIFDKFYRAEGQTHSGSGLGLFIVKGVVDAHGGRAEARLRPGGGLEISCWFPTQ